MKMTVLMVIIMVVVMMPLVQVDATLDALGEQVWTYTEEGNVDGANDILENNTQLANWTKTSAGRTFSLLAHAVMHSRPQIVETLIAIGADLDFGNDHDVSPLMMAAESHCVECARLLIDAGADVNHTSTSKDFPLYYAGLHNSREIAELLIAASADVNMIGFEGYTTLLVAAWAEAVDVIRVLLESGADPNIPNESGLTPIFWALNRENSEVLSILVSGGADINHQYSSKDWTPMIYMIILGKTTLVPDLLNYCPDLTLRTSTDETALELAQDKNDTQSAALIQEKLDKPCTMNNVSYSLGATVYQDCEEVECLPDCKWNVTGNPDPSCTTTTVATTAADAAAAAAVVPAPAAAAAGDADCAPAAAVAGDAAMIPADAPNAINSGRDGDVVVVVEQTVNH